MTTFHNAKTRKVLKELPLFRKLSNKEQLEYMRMIKNAAALNEHEKAVQHAEIAAKLEPQDPFSYTALSVTYQRAFAGTQNTEYIRSLEATTTSPPNSWGLRKPAQSRSLHAAPPGSEIMALKQ